MSSETQPVVETNPAAEPADLENNTSQKAVPYPAYPRLEAFIDRPDNKTPATQGIDAVAVAELKDDAPLPQKTARFISNSNDPRIQSLIKAGHKPPPWLQKQKQQTQSPSRPRQRQWRSARTQR